MSRKAAGQFTSPRFRTALILAPVSCDVAVCAESAPCARSVKPSTQSAVVVDKPEDKKSEGGYGDMMGMM